MHWSLLLEMDIHALHTHQANHNHSWPIYQANQGLLFLFDNITLQIPPKHSSISFFSIFLTRWQYRKIWQETGRERGSNMQQRDPDQESNLGPLQSLSTWDVRFTNWAKRRRDILQFLNDSFKLSDENSLTWFPVHLSQTTKISQSVFSRRITPSISLSRPLPVGLVFLGKKKKSTAQRSMPLLNQNRERHFYLVAINR